MGRKVIDLVGQKFGRLTVLSMSDKHTSSGTHWNCICDCGNTTVVSGTNLRSGRTRSCGCLSVESSKRSAAIAHAARFKQHNLIGQRFGMLTVLERTDQRNHRGNTMWLCKCDCGNTKLISTQALNQGNTISCGCNRAKKASERANDPESNLTLGRKAYLSPENISNRKFFIRNPNSAYPSIANKKHHSYTVHPWKVRLGQQYIGAYSNIIDAIAARMDAEMEHYGVTYAQQYYNKNPRQKCNKQSWFDRTNNKWRSSITFCGKRHYLGTFNTSEEASAASQDAMNKLTKYL